MAQIDLFANQLLEEAKRFLERAKEAASDPASEAANLHAALMLAFCALEAHVNAIAQEFSGRPELSAHEKGMLLEQEVRLEGGKFQLRAGLRMTKLEDRIEFYMTNSPESLLTDRRPGGLNLGRPPTSETNSLTLGMCP